MKRALFIDRDGTLVYEPADEQVDALSKVKFLPGVFTYLGRIARELDYELVLVTNQDGLGTDAFPEETFWPAHRLIMDTLASEGIVFREECIDRHFPADNAPTHKPGTAMLKSYQLGEWNLAESYVIGDRWSDVELAQNLGAKSIFISPEAGEGADLTAPDWQTIYQFLRTERRKVTIARKTKETDIALTFSASGSGQARVQTGLGFFDHMLDQVARHSGCDLTATVQGDLDVDEHHTVEDLALALGEAVSQSLGNRVGITRYAFVLPMDEAEARVSIDLGGRPYLQWDVPFQRERVGDVPTELWKHFFQSFCQTAGCTLNVACTAENDHHRIEAVFKGFAKVLGQAVALTGSDAVPSTKGVL